MRDGRREVGCVEGEGGVSRFSRGSSFGSPFPCPSSVFPSHLLFRFDVCDLLRSSLDLKETTD